MASHLSMHYGHAALAPMQRGRSSITNHSYRVGGSATLKHSWLGASYQIMLMPHCNTLSSPPPPKARCVVYYKSWQRRWLPLSCCIPLGRSRLLMRLCHHSQARAGWRMSASSLYAPSKRIVVLDHSQDLGEAPLPPAPSPCINVWPFNHQSEGSVPAAPDTPMTKGHLHRPLEPSHQREDFPLPL